MRIVLIAAVDEMGVIGVGKEIPWVLSSDLKRFKSLTMGHHLVMGRKTWESIGHALPGRTSIIITHQVDYTAPGGLVTHSLAEALGLASQRGEDEVFIIGGAEIFAQALPQADRIYLTRVHTTTPHGDTFFPPFIPDDWQILETIQAQADDRNQAATTFTILERITPNN